MNPASVPIIHGSLDLLRPKLKKYEHIKIKKRLPSNRSLVFAVREYSFDPTIPILEERHLTKDPKPAKKKKNSPSSHPLPSTQQLVLVDTLITKGPDKDEDEFRQYDDDDDEEETTLSKNLKKIRTQPIVVKPPPQPVQRQSTLVQNLTSGKFSESPVQQQQRQNQNSTPAERKKTPPPAQPPKEITLVEINQYLTQSNMNLVIVELGRQKDKLMSDIGGRETLKKAVNMCLDRDDTFSLLGLLPLVFAYNFNNDSDFWQALVGKLKRKNNPHSKCLTFKSPIDPQLTKNNYQSIVKQIGEHFENTNPTLTLPWTFFCYIRDASKTQAAEKPTLPPPREQEPAGYIAQENRAPDGNRFILKIGRATTQWNEFQIKVPISKVSNNFNPKLLVNVPR